MKFKTEQEAFWYGEFGNEYLTRNTADLYLPSNIRLFSKILEKTTNIDSVLEFGANIGLNLRAIQTLLPNVRCSAIEINEKAVSVLKNVIDINDGDIFQNSILEFEPKKLYDLTLIKGVLIHINPDELNNVYQKLYESSSKYICVAEYYNPSPISINYRGHENRLFKRDFVGEILNLYPDLKLVDYGFVYHRDNNFPQDDITWFLLEK
ncbi:pseudaminic acid biosynthesis-associated methylase [Lysinibacillus sp. NPDC056185]|uniref:pseudaminic acid biosynthesis-associated methylase n=1 Tax=Lysinibacillus sp. NPDC056185 TaxID=3345739 RepID=UPI0039EE435A